MGVDSYPESSVFYNVKAAFFRLTKLKTQEKRQSLSQNLLALRNSPSSSALTSHRFTCVFPEAFFLGAGWLCAARAFLSVPFSSIRPLIYGQVQIRGQVPVLSTLWSEHAGG